MKLSAAHLLLLAALGSAQQDFTKYVDVFYATENGGNMFPGVVGVPYATVKLGPDLDSGDSAKSGYMPAGNLTGFSLMHESGTGGGPKYGTVSQLPLSTNAYNPTAYTIKRATPDQGSVGYYKSSLANGITVELAGTAHVGFIQYTYPAGQGANILVDVAHFLPSNRHANLSQHYSNGMIQTFSDGHYEGSGTYYGGWNLSPEWTVYFCGKFSDKPTAAQLQTVSGNSVLKVNNDTQVSGTNGVGAVFSFSGSAVSSRIGISFISSAKACQFVDNEIPAGTPLSQLVQQSKNAWNSQVLSKLQTTETNTTFLSQLYTSMYGVFLLPSNRTGENPQKKYSPTVPYYDDLYTLWDLYRCTTPLWHILQPQFYSEFLLSLVETAKVDGYLPDGRSSNFNGRTQGGSSADNVLADAFVKHVQPYSVPAGLEKQENWWLTAYRYMVKDAEVTPANNIIDPQAPDSSTQHGRSALPDWLTLNFISTRFSRSVSRAVEYSGNDFALSQVAAGLGRDDDAAKYLARSRNWRLHWNKDATSYGNVSGFLMPKNPDGTWAGGYSPASCQGCYWGDAFYEATPWQYTLNVPHDVDWLVRLSGGQDGFNNRLQNSMIPMETNAIGLPGRSQPTQTPVIDWGNEPSFGTTHLFHWIKAQDLSVSSNRAIVNRLYSSGTGGLPGNSDAGAMQSWLLWNYLGLYPVTGQNLFLLGSPWVANMTISHMPGKTLTVLSNTDQNASGSNFNNHYIQSVSLNGNQIQNNWLTYDDLFTGSNTVLQFNLTTQPQHWDVNGVTPPSPASQSNITGAAMELILQQARASRDIAIGVAVGTVFLAILIVLGALMWVAWKRRGVGVWGLLGLGKRRDDLEKGKLDDKPAAEQRRRPEVTLSVAPTTVVPSLREPEDDEKTLAGDIMDVEHIEAPEVENRHVTEAEHTEAHTAAREAQHVELPEVDHIENAPSPGEHSVRPRTPTVTPAGHEKTSS